MSYKEQILSNLVIPEGKLLLAFSGGEDSLALLSLLPKERSEALYVNHNLRDEKELEREIRLNSENARRFGIPLKTVTLERGKVLSLAEKEKIGVEAAARKLRYEALLAEDADYILTAHHRDDQAETLIMRLLSNSPLYRLEGIRRERGRIFRPFLTVAKELISAYAAEAGLTFSLDSTNSDTKYMRNYIRKEILSRLSWSEKDTLLRISLNVQEMNSREKDIFLEEGACFRFSRPEYLNASELKREEVFYRINLALGYSSLFSRTECRLCTEAIEKMSSYHSGRFTLKVNGSDVRVFRKKGNLVLPAGKSFTYGHLEYTVDDSDADDKSLDIDFSLVNGPLIFRESREKDCIDLKEGRKKLRDLEKEYKVPYFYIIEDRSGIVAVFSRLFGAKDRISRRFIGSSGVRVTLKGLIN